MLLHVLFVAQIKRFNIELRAQQLIDVELTLKTTTTHTLLLINNTTY